MVVRSAPRSDSDLFSQFFREFHETLEQASGPQFEKLFREFDAAFKESRTQRVDSTPHLDVLQVFGLGMDELRHSRVLSWFLDADAEHEQGVLFAQALLRLVAGEQAPEILDGEHYIVEREKHSRTDVSIYQRQRFAVFIENKVRASLGVPLLEGPATAETDKAAEKAAKAAEKAAAKEAAAAKVE